MYMKCKRKRLIDLAKHEHVYSRARFDSDRNVSVSFKIIKK